MRITEILAEGDLKEFDPGPNGPGPFKIYIEKYYIGKLFPTFDEALEEVEFLRDADPKSSTHSWRIVDGTGKTVWEYDIGDDIDAQRRANKIQFRKSGGQGMAETTGDNKFDAMMGTMQGNAELLKSVMSEFLTIYYGALDEEDMTDHIAYNLGDFFNGVKRSRDPVLQKSYAYVRDLAEEDVDVQANGTLRAIRMMLGDPAYTPPPKPPMSAADQSWVDRLVNAMTAALASHGIKAHPNWNKKT